MTQSPVRPHLFVDDNAWEALDRSRALPSQKPAVGASAPTDPRLYLLRDQVKPQSGQLAAVYGQTIDEILSQQFIPAFSELMRMDLDGASAPVNLLERVLRTAAGHLKEALPKIEAALATNAGPRHLTFLIAPWDKAPATDAAAKAAWERGSRYSPRRMGFSTKRRTPVRDWGVKHWLYDEEGYPIVTGLKGNLGNRVNDVAQHNTAIVLQNAYDETPHLVPPYVYPVAFLINLTVKPGASTIRLQALLGMQPLLQRLEPATTSPTAEITHAGVPQPGGFTANDTSTNYPMMLVSFEHLLKNELRDMRLNFNFGTWEGYHPFRRRMKLNTANSAWRLTPYLGGDAIKGSTASYWTHLRVPIRVHMTSFDIVTNLTAQTAKMENLKTSIEVFDRRAGALVPFATNVQIGLTDGQPTQQAAQEVQNTANQMIAKAFADAKRGAKDQALKKFPLAALFIDR
ncbi:MAG: hypothetical protein IT285_03120 [Bdellovibrionales bacterium]|nr:hypothetical protein [Bdellovibrionales bacterium]